MNLSKESAKAVASVAISIAVVLGVVMTSNPNCLWGLALIVAIYNA